MRIVVGVVNSSLLITRHAVAQSGESGDDGGTLTSGAVADALVSALTELLRTLFSPIEGLIETHGNGLLQLIVGTPHPTTAFGTPAELPWVPLYRYYWSTIVPLALLLFGLAVGLVILLETTSHLFSGYHRANLKRRAFSGLLGVLSWWWVAAFSLQLTDQLVGLLLPDLSTVSLFQTVSFSGIGLLGVVASLSVDLVLFVLLAVLYLGRRLVLFGFVLGMPLLVVAWIPGVGPFGVVARFAKRLAGFYVPFLLMPIPVAVLLRLGGLLGDAATLSMEGIGAWLTALVIPFVALASPVVLIWQAGALLFLTERVARHASRTRLRRRLQQGQALGSQMRREGHRPIRGLRSISGRRSPGEGRSGSGGSAPTDDRSRGGRLGHGLRSAPSRLRDRFRTDHEGAETRQEPVQFEPTEYDTGPRTETTDDRTDD